MPNPCDDRIRYEINEDSRVTLQIQISGEGSFHSDTLGSFLDDDSTPPFKGVGDNEMLLNWPINPAGGNLMRRQLELSTSINNKSEGDFEVVVSYDLTGGVKPVHKELRINTSPGIPVICTFSIKFASPI